MFALPRVSPSFSRLAVATLAATIALPPLAAAQTMTGQPFHGMGTGALPMGVNEISVGTEYRTGGFTPTPARNDEDEGELLKLPIITWRFGLGRADLILSGTLAEAFRRDKPLAGNSHTDEGFGDFEFWVKLEALSDGPSRPGLAFAVGAKAPIADNDINLGTNEADIFAAILLSETWGSTAMAFDFGFAIVGDPLINSRQDDLLTMSISACHGRRHALAWEVYGRGFADSDNDLDEATLAAGYLFHADRFVFTAKALQGLVENSGGLGLSCSATWRIGQ